MDLPHPKPNLSFSWNHFNCSNHPIKIPLHLIDTKRPTKRNSAFWGTPCRWNTEKPRQNPPPRSGSPWNLPSRPGGRQFDRGATNPSPLRTRKTSRSWRGRSRGNSEDSSSLRRRISRAEQFSRRFEATLPTTTPKECPAPDTMEGTSTSTRSSSSAASELSRCFISILRSGVWIFRVTCARRPTWRSIPVFSFPRIGSWGCWIPIWVMGIIPQVGRRFRVHPFSLRVYLVRRTRKQGTLIMASWRRRRAITGLGSWFAVGARAKGSGILRGSGRVRINVCQFWCVVWLISVVSSQPRLGWTVYDMNFGRWICVRNLLHVGVFSSFRGFSFELTAFSLIGLRAVKLSFSVFTHKFNPGFLWSRGLIRPTMPSFSTFFFSIYVLQINSTIKKNTNQ